MIQISDIFRFHHLPLFFCAILTLSFFNIEVFAQNITPEMYARSIINEGNTARLEHVFRKAREGKPITVAVIGGSITAGAKATTWEKAYGNLVANWWKAQFPMAKINYVNAGIGATGSDYGALRAGRDLLNHKPDFVVVEYAVNDGSSPYFQETLEGLLRQILRQPNHPAIVMLFMMNNLGGNAQESQIKVGSHYDLPMISYRDAFWQEIESKRMDKSVIFADEVHPNDTGHADVADLVDHYLQGVLDKTPFKGALPSIPPVPSPLISDQYSHVRLYGVDNLKPTVNQGWEMNGKGLFWESKTPGSVLEFKVSGKQLLISFFRIRGDMGRASVQVDNLPAQTMDGWFDQTWGGYLVTQLIAKNLSNGTHTIRIELLNDKDPQSTGNDCKVFYIGAAGVK
jgi:lysophospholipase L1-like esterase